MAFSMNHQRPGPLIPPLAQEAPPRIPAPEYRHASPSGPWPWQDLDDGMDSASPQTPLVPNIIHAEKEEGEAKTQDWTQYPQSLFPNWTPRQIRRSRMMEICGRLNMRKICEIYHVDIGDDGHFSVPEKHTVGSKQKEEGLWNLMQRKRPKHTRVRALFVENLSVSVMQMLGTKYNIEPFYYTSSVNWIPSRYQEDVRQHDPEGDHITITLTFLRALKVSIATKASAVTFDGVANIQPTLLLRNDNPNRLYDQTLLVDLLAIHMIRTRDSSTIISYHPSHDQRTTSAKRLHSRVRLAGESVYWQNIFQKSADPTLVLLTILWYALYAWDESLATLWEHISKLELSVLGTKDIRFTQELHKIRDHLLYYVFLLEDFRKSVLFTLGTPNPAMDTHEDSERETSRKILEKECNYLLLEIERLFMSRDMQEKRLKNVMDLAFNSVNIEDSKRMKELTEAALRDSAAMKQISYLTMVFLPASFSAAVFGMNIQEITPNTFGTLAKYLATTIPLTAITIWVFVAFQSTRQVPEGEGEPSMLTRLWWPVWYVKRLFERRRKDSGTIPG